MELLKSLGILFFLFVVFPLVCIFVFREMFNKAQRLRNWLINLRIGLLDRRGFNYPFYFIIFWWAVLGFFDYRNLWPSAVYVFPSGSLGIIQSTTDFILYLTLLAILIYSVETYRLRDETYRMAEATIDANQLSLKVRKEMTMANQLSIQPCLVLEYQREDGDGSQWLFRLKNIGKGAAINIWISSNPPYSFELNGLNALKDGDQGSVVLRKNNKDLTTEEWQALGSNPIRATIFFDRTKKLNWHLETEIAVKNPPKVEIVRTVWIPD